MEILNSDASPSVQAPSEYFTGTVWLDQIAVPTAPSGVRVVRVTFEPGARTAWHTHSFGQVLHVLAGVGRVQTAGEPVRTVKPGETVLIKPGERHWHGAAPRFTMVHLAVQRAGEDGKDVVWSEHVTEAEYHAT
jgi:quercetin dioxygenase-like cupin family protein